MSGKKLKGCQIFEVKVYDNKGKLKKTISQSEALEDFHFDRRTNRNVFVVTDLERKQFWGRATRELEPKWNIKKKLTKETTSRKDRSAYKKRLFKYKVVCKECLKTVMKQSEKAQFCSFECQSKGSRIRVYAKFKKKKNIHNAIKFYLKINKL